MTTTPKNPRTQGEWQDAADAAHVLLSLDAARQYGLIEGGPECNQERCAEILRLAKRRGITPSEGCIERGVAELLQQTEAAP